MDEGSKGPNTDVSPSRSQLLLGARQASGHSLARVKAPQSTSSVLRFAGPPANGPGRQEQYRVDEDEEDECEVDDSAESAMNDAGPGRHVHDDEYVQSQSLQVAQTRDAARKAVSTNPAQRR